LCYAIPNVSGKIHKPQLLTGESYGKQHESILPVVCQLWDTAAFPKKAQDY